MCICKEYNQEILKMIKNESLPDEALVNTCCWKRICEVRGLNFSAVNSEVWRSICAKRGFLQARQNPRGF